MNQTVFIALIFVGMIGAVVFFYLRRATFGHEVDIPEATTANNLQVKSMESMTLNQEDVKELARVAANPDIYVKFKDWREFYMLVVGNCRIIFCKSVNTINVVGISVLYGMGRDVEDALDHLEHAAAQGFSRVRFFCASNPQLRKVLIKNRGYAKTGNKCEVVKAMSKDIV